MIFAVQPRRPRPSACCTPTPSRTPPPPSPTPRPTSTAKGITYVEKTGNTADEVLSAANALAAGQGRRRLYPDRQRRHGRCRCRRLRCFADAGIPHYTGADSFVTAGRFRHLRRELHRPRYLHRRYGAGDPPGRRGAHLPRHGRRHHHRQHRDRRSRWAWTTASFDDLAGTVVEVETTAE